MKRLGKNEDAGEEEDRRGVRAGSDVGEAEREEKEEEEETSEKDATDEEEETKEEGMMI